MCDQGDVGGTNNSYDDQQSFLMPPPPAPKDLETDYLEPLPPGYIYQLWPDPQNPDVMKVHTVMTQLPQDHQKPSKQHSLKKQKPPTKSARRYIQVSSKKILRIATWAPAEDTAVPMMIKDEHQQDVGPSRVPLAYIKEEVDVATPPSDNVGAEQHQQPQQQEQNQPQPPNNDPNQQPQQQIVPIAIGATGAAGSANASLNETAFSSETMPNIFVQQMTPVTSRTAVGRLSYQKDVLYLLESGHVVIGRNSSTSVVHFHVGRSSFISRKHFQVVHDPINQEFFVIIVSKNGIFVNETFQRNNEHPERLPPTCRFRFPSTDIRIEFESFLRSPQRQIVVPAPIESGVGTLPSAENPFCQPRLAQSQLVQQHLPQLQAQQMIPPPVPAVQTGGPQQHSAVKVKTIKRSASPPPSPTGTLSAANSCPTSPRPNVREYHVVYAGQQQQQHTQIGAAGGPSTSAAAVQQQLYTANNGYTAQLQTQPKTIIFTPPAAPVSASPAVLAPPPPPPGHPNEFDKPLFSYAQLIVQSISASPEKQLTLSGIYSFITKHYPYYRREANKGWQNSIRHNLSLNRYFLKVERSQDEPGKGSFWRIDPNSEAKLIDQSYRKRRQRGNQNFRAPYGLPRSAPASPNHMDTSQEASPLHDIVLQSAPGSPDRFQQPPQPTEQQQQQQQQQHQQHEQHQQQQNGGGGSNHMQIWPE